MAPALSTTAPVEPAICWLRGVAGTSGLSFYWAPYSRCPVGEGVVAYSTAGKPEFEYEAFNPGRDFGPLDIGRTVLYCRWVDALCAAHADCRAIVHLTSDESEEEQVNTATLCGAYLVLAMGLTAEEAFRPFRNEPLRSFVDCRGDGSICTTPGQWEAEENVEFELSVLDVLRGLERVRKLGWVDYHTFGAEEHASMLHPAHGDMSWLLPGRALALASPWAEPRNHDGHPVCTPPALSPYFQRNDIRVVIQCNYPENEEEGERCRLLQYDPRHFQEVGIQHVHLPFEDGGCPSVDLLLKFLEVVKAVGGSFAVHCRSGLGRTATLIGAYAIRNFGFTARSYIGWARVMRPGTVHGSQQQYLVNLEPHIRLGAFRPLSSLDQRERLRLLPRRELRFWALDRGMPAPQTAALPTHEIVELLATAATEAQPTLSTPPLLPRDPANYQDGEARRIWAAATKEAALLLEEKKRVPVAATERAPFLSVSRGACGVAARTSIPATASTPPDVPIAPKAADDRTSADTIQELTKGALQTRPSACVTSSTDGSTGATTTSPAQTSGGASNGWQSNDWDEMVRYLQLLMAVQAEGSPSWANVQRCAEKLREHCRAAARAIEIDGAHSVGARGDGAESELRQVRARRSAAAFENEAQAATLDEALRKSRDLQLACEKLRFQISFGQEANESERKREEDHNGALASDFQRDKAKLDLVDTQLQGLRNKFLQQEGLDRGQLEHAEALKQEIVGARESRSRSAAACSWQRARLDAAQTERLRRRVESASPLMAGFLDEGSAAKVSHKPPAVLPFGSGASSAIERLREQFQAAKVSVKQTLET